MFNLMNEDNFLHVFLNRVGDIIVSNLLFLLCSVPIVTIGPALTALYHTMLKIAKGDEDRTARTFLRAFRQNFLQSLLLWLLILGAAIITFADLRYFQLREDALGSAMYLLSLGVAVLLVLFTLFIFPVVAAFSGNLRQLARNAFLFLFMRFHKTLLIALITLFPLFMTYRDLALLPLSAFYWFFLGFGLTAYLNAFLFYSLFRPFVEKEDTEALSSV